MASKKTFNLSDISDHFQDMVANEIDSYVKELNTSIDNVVHEVAVEFSKDLKIATPVSTTPTGNQGHLRDNIKVSKRTKQGHKYCEVHFGKKGWLSTLHEYGWTTKNGRIVRNNQSFVRKTFDTNKEQYFRKIKEAIIKVNGGN